MSRLVGSSYQYLQQSKIPTNKFQRSLPRLKIPKIEKTCQRYAASIEPVFANDSRYSKALDVTKHFQNGPAKDLQKELLSYDKSLKQTSYINDFWFNMYLSSRLPLPLNFNPFVAWRDMSQSNLNHQLVRSSNIIISAIRFKRSLEENVLEPEVFHLNPKKIPNSYHNIMSMTPDVIATYVSFLFKAFPLDMGQYKNLFNSTRIPCLGKDKIVKYDTKNNRHVLVIRNGQFYVFDVVDENGDLMSPDYIYANLKYIAEQQAPSAEQLSISELTTSNRDYWAKERDQLINVSQRNQENLEKLDSSIFVLCLDDSKFRDDQKVEGAHNFLHGYNSRAPLNRWFDKSLSFIVTKDGHAAINFEHSWGDGVAILRLFNEIYNDGLRNAFISEPISNVNDTHVRVKTLVFDLDARMKESISISRQAHAKAAGGLEFGAVEYEKLNRDHLKKSKLSPDAMSQLSFQLAFRKIYGKAPVTYESCSTAAFKGGRTETVRPCTNETNRAVEAIISKKMSNSELKICLQKASGRHYQLCKEASMGDGFDRHMFALREMALRSKTCLPDIFSDPIYLENQHYTLSTSTLYGECFAGGGFAPVVPDGFGLGYGYVDANFGVLVSSYKDHRNNRQFVQALEESLSDISNIIDT